MFAVYTMPRGIVPDASDNEIRGVLQGLKNEGNSTSRSTPPRIRFSLGPVVEICLDFRENGFVASIYHEQPAIRKCKAADSMSLLVMTLNFVDLP